MGIQIATIFSSEESIPQPFRIQEPIEQREYLINGELKIWQGSLNPVLSPIYLRRGDESSQKVLGRTPLLTTNESLEALDAAVNAYNLGNGAWPTMSVVERIEHVEDFLKGMRSRRNEVVTLLMWEIGKSLKDSEREFDRTCDYIVETIKNNKSLQRTRPELGQAG
jgi:glyceraldehyde-3-phosphate dehydrogenase (NADP+)